MAKKNRKIIIVNCAFTGAVHSPATSEHPPVTPTQIVDSAAGAARYLEK